jgi:enoyl-CoA hydratase/carnithine racemase
MTIAADLVIRLTQLDSELVAWEKRGLPEHDAPCRVLIIEAELAGRDSDIWIAGGDLIELSQLTEQGAGGRYSAAMSSVLAGLESLPIPVLAVIDGAAIGGGTEFALAADIRIASPSCRFDFRQLQVGLCSGYGSCHRLIAAVGFSRAKDFLLRGRTIAGEELLNSGLVHELAPSREDLFKLAIKIAEDLCALHPRAIAEQKRMLAQAQDLLNERDRNSEVKAMESLWMNDIHRSVLNRFVAAKKPHSPNT